MEWGSKDKQEFLRKLWETSPTGEIPKALANKPKLRPWNALYFEAFHVLEASRTISDSGYSKIPLSEMTSYFITYEVHGVDERDYFIKMIKALDAVYIPHMNALLREQLRKQKKAAEFKAKKGRA